MEYDDIESPITCCMSHYLAWFFNSHYPIQVIRGYLWTESINN